MSKAWEKFEELARWQQLAASALVLMVFILLAYQVLLGGVRERVAELEERRASISAQLLKERRIAKDLPRYKAEVATLEVQLERALRELPDERDIPDLLKAIADRAKNTGLEVALFRPDPEQAQEFFVEIPVRMSVEGSFHQVASFLDEVGRMARIVNVRGIQMGNPRVSDRGASLTSEYSVVTFRYLTETERAERAAAVAAAKDSKRRRR
jgi:type IV pilus assembly protein PilO